MPKRIGYCLGKDQFAKQCADCARKVSDERPEGIKIIVPKVFREKNVLASHCGIYLPPGSTNMISKDTNKDRRKKVEKA